MTIPNLQEKSQTTSIVRASPVPLYLQIEQELRGAMQAGDLGALAQVPSEAELAERFSVSRMTARKALDRLVGEGLLFRQPGKGTFVAPPKIAHGPSQQLSFSAAMREMALPHATKVLEAGLIRAPSTIAEALGVGRGGSVVYMRRLRYVSDEPAAIHAAYLPSRFSMLLQEDLTGSLTELMEAIGARVAETHDTVEAVTATGDEAQLLAVRSGSPLVLIRGVAYSAAEQPVRYTDALYRGDRFRFIVDRSGPPDLRLQLKPPEGI